MDRSTGKVKSQGKVRWLYLAATQFCDEILNESKVTISLSELLSKLSSGMGEGIHILRLKKNADIMRMIERKLTSKVKRSQLNKKIVRGLSKKCCNKVVEKPRPKIVD